MMIFILLFAFFVRMNSQVSTSFNGIDVLISNKTSLDPFNTGQIHIAAFSSTSIFTISSNSIQIFSKYNSTVVESNITSITTAEILQNIIFDQNYSTMIIIGYNTTATILHFYNITDIYNPVKINLTVSFSFGQPSYGFFAKYTIYSFYQNNGGDFVCAFNTSDSSVNVISLATTNSSFSVSPNRKYALVWTQYSKVYIYSVLTNFSLVTIYNGSIVGTPGLTQNISFSADSTLAIIEVDGYSSIQIISVLNGTLVASFFINEQIISVDFIDTSNRFVLINCLSRNLYIYDSVADVSSKFALTFIADQLLIDQNSSQLIVGQGGMLNNVLEMNIWINNTLFIPILFGISKPTKAFQSEFYYCLNISQRYNQNKTISYLKSTLLVIEVIVKNFNLVVFSSPFTCLFLSFLNYFTLNSLYVLLNIKLPQVIFRQLQSFFNSVNTNILSTVGVHPSVPQLTDQLVNQNRALYFEISSDLIGQNYYPLAMLLINIFFTKIIFVIMNKLATKKIVQKSFLKVFKQKIYFGLIVSIITGIILPWKFVVYGKILNFKTKLNAVTQYFLYAFMAHFLWTTYLSFLNHHQPKEKVKRNKINEASTIEVLQQKIENKSVKYKKIYQLPQWMIAFQNFLYSSLILLSNYYGFLIIILIAKIIELILFIRHSKKIRLSKYLHIGSFLCQIVFNCTFFVFAATNNTEIVVFTCIVCLFFYILGAILNIMIVIMLILLAIRAAFANYLCPNKILPDNGEKDHKDNEQKQSQNKAPIRLPKIKINKMRIRRFPNIKTNQRIKANAYNFKQPKTKENILVLNQKENGQNEGKLQNDGNCQQIENTQENLKSLKPLENEGNIQTQNNKSDNIEGRKVRFASKIIIIHQQ